MRLRQVLGALVYDVPGFVSAMSRGRWALLHNRSERVTTDRRGVRCEWEFTSELHVANVFPSAGARLMRAAFARWPAVLRDAPEALSDAPQVSFVIGHRGLQRLPHLLVTLRSIAGQSGVPIEVVVVEQSQHPEIKDRLPEWVLYVHTPTSSSDEQYNRAWTLNAGARAARGEILILHDNDMVVPARYAAEAQARAAEGADFLELKRFTFYLSEADTARVFATGELPGRAAVTVVQNLRGASIVVRRDAYFAVGGFDEEFVGWGGEDNEFWERALTTGRVNQFGYLPFIHLWHAPQKGKLLGSEAPAIKRYYELRDVAPEERIQRLRGRRTTTGS